MKNNFGYIETDSEFKQLASSLDDCSRSRGDCEKCPLLEDCRQQFDYLATKALDKGLTHSDRLQFENKFKKMKKQLTLV